MPRHSTFGEGRPPAKRQKPKRKDVEAEEAERIDAEHKRLKQDFLRREAKRART